MKIIEIIQEGLSKLIEVMFNMMDAIDNVIESIIKNIFNI